jgi:multiple sugar transport system permease protein
MARTKDSGIQGHDAKLALLGRYAMLVALAIVFVFPILFMFMSSLKPDTQIFQDVTSMRAYLPVGDISLDNYGRVFDRVPVGRFIFNSLFVTVTQVGLGLLINSMAGFALSRVRFRGQKILLTLIIATLIIPGEAIAIPMLQIVAQLPWIGLDGLRPVFESGWLDT